MEQLVEFINILNKALPGAWEATLRQAYIHGVIYMIVAVISAISAVWFYREFLAEMTKAEKAGNKNNDTGGFEFVVGGACALVSIITFIMAMIILINPEYHAIQMLKP